MYPFPVLSQQCSKNSTFGITGPVNTTNTQMLPGGTFYVQINPYLWCDGKVVQWTVCLKIGVIFRNTLPAYTVHPVILRPLDSSEFTLVGYGSITVTATHDDSQSTLCLSQSVGSATITVQDGDLLGLVVHRNNQISGIYHETSNSTDEVRTCFASSDGNFTSQSNQRLSGLQGSLSTVSRINCTVNNNEPGLFPFHTGVRLDAGIDIEPLGTDASVIGECMLCSVQHCVCACVCVIVCMICTDNTFDSKQR